MSTPHIEAKIGEISNKVIMPGDPLRAKMIAENYLENARLVNKVRNMFAYTGYYNGDEVTVMGSGMGVPSMGIYSYELFNIYGVEKIIRIGTAGGLNEELNLGDIVLAQAVSTDSNYVNQFNLAGMYSPIADFNLLYKAYNYIKDKTKIYVGNIWTSDIFYNDSDQTHIKWKEMNILAVEMETAALYVNAAKARKKALSICTISDLPLKGDSMSSTQRQEGLHKMIEYALEIIK